MCKIAGCPCAGNAGNVFPATDFKGNRLLAIPVCITARTSHTCRDACRVRKPAVAGKTFPAFPAHAQPAILRIWKEAHVCVTTWRIPWDMWYSRTESWRYTRFTYKRIWPCAHSWRVCLTVSWVWWIVTVHTWWPRWIDCDSWWPCLTRYRTHTGLEWRYIL